MAASSINIFLDSNMNMFMDPQRRAPFPGPLFQKEHDPSTYYINEACTIVANLGSTWDDTGSCKEKIVPAPSPSPSPSLPANEGFNKEETLFLIDMMREHLESEAEGLPKTLKELYMRLKNSKYNKNLWKDAAHKLSTAFERSFCPDKIARKWQTLADGYTQLKDNNQSAGRGTIRFQYFKEMDDLLGGHDIVFPVVGTAAGIEVRRPEALSLHRSSVPCNTDAAGSCSSPNTGQSTPSGTPTRPHKRRREDTILKFLRESEEFSERSDAMEMAMAQRCHEELLEQLKSSQKAFESVMMTFLDKL